jgi:hypothetical protein
LLLTGATAAPAAEAQLKTGDVFKFDEATQLIRSRRWQMPKGGDVRELIYDKKSKERGSRREGGFPQAKKKSFSESKRYSALECFHQLG